VKRDDGFFFHRYSYGFIHQTTQKERFFFSREKKKMQPIKFSLSISRHTRKNRKEGKLFIKTVEGVMMKF